MHENSKSEYNINKEPENALYFIKKKETRSIVSKIVLKSLLMLLGV